MFRICCLIVLAGIALNAQPSQDVARLNPPLMKALVSAGSADDAISRSLSDAMMSIALQTRRPTQRDVTGLANALRGALAGRELSDAQTSVLSQSIVGVLRGEATSNFTLASGIRAELTALRVGDLRTDLIVRRFVAVGEAVRGPDDFPVREEIGPTVK